MSVFCLYVGAHMPRSLCAGQRSAALFFHHVGSGHQTLVLSLLIASAIYPLTERHLTSLKDGLLSTQF